MRWWAWGRYKRRHTKTMPLRTRIGLLVLALSCAAITYPKQSEAVDYLSFHANVSSRVSFFPHTWKECVGSGHAALGLRPDWQKQLKIVHDELGFKRVRFHGLLDDDMSVVLPNGSYSFAKVDTVYDYIMSIGMYPYVELSFMPQYLASGGRTYLHYKANVTPPRNYEQWAELIEALAQHWVDRYGIKNVSQWFIEVWNEPNLYNKIIGGFWDGTQDEYFKLYNYTALAVKKVSGAFIVGGPATSAGGWLKDFITFCQKNKVPLDFISTHGYPSGKEGLVEAVQNASTEVGGQYPLVFSEYNSGLYLLDDNHDTPFAAAFVAQVIPQVVNYVEGISYWTFSDIFEEIYFDTEPFHDGYGLLTVDGIPKPAFRAFQLLHRLSNYTVGTQWDGGNTSEVTAFVFTHPSNYTTVQVLLSNFNPPLHLPRDFNVTCTLTVLPTAVPVVTMYRISTTEANPRGAWEDMGRPASLTSEQRDELMLASQVNPAQLPFNHTSNFLSFGVYLPYRGKKSYIGESQFFLLHAEHGSSGNQLCKRKRLELKI